MIIIPGWIIALLTFPGVIMHEAAHMLFCRLSGVAVFKVCFFQLKQNVSGYVIHEEPKSFNSSFFISVGPFIVNSLLCILFCFPASIPIKVFNQEDIFSYFVSWLGISFGMNAFPSNQDARLILSKAKDAVKSLNMLAVLSYPLVIFVYISNALRVIWFDAIYGVLIGFFLPKYILKLLS